MHVRTGFNKDMASSIRDSHVSRIDTKLEHVCTDYKRRIRKGLPTQIIFSLCIGEKAY